MTRLSRYILGLSAGQSVAIFAMAATLVWLVETLRFFDLLTAKGQGLLVLAAQASLVAIPLVRGILGACMGIGLARVLKNLHDSRELHAVHTGLRVGALARSILVFAIAGGLVVLVTTSFFEPAARVKLEALSSDIAANLVGRSLSPGRFTHVAPGVIMEIGGRKKDGTTTDFFASDSRDAGVTRTYIAKTAVIVTQADGYGLSLKDGVVQNVTAEGGYSEIKFTGYQIGLDRLTETHKKSDSARLLNSLVLAGQITGGGPESDKAQHELNLRIGAALRLTAFVLVVACLFAFPTGRRVGARMPRELAVLLMGFAESLIDQAVEDRGAMWPYATTMVMALIVIGILAWKTGLVRRFLPKRRAGGFA